MYIPLLLEDTVLAEALASRHKENLQKMNNVFNKVLVYINIPVLIIRRCIKAHINSQMKHFNISDVMTQVERKID